MKLRITLEKIQHISFAEFEMDLESDGLVCITGKNGAGKTTLIKAIRNLTNADTFKKTSSDDIFTKDSAINYGFGDQQANFVYDVGLSTINCKSSIPQTLKSKISVELPIPYGERFNFFQKISSADSDIRKAIVLNRHRRPTELIEFLKEIYQDSKFDQLVEITIKKSTYYCSLLPSGRYLREDYFSSGEYFLVSLYRKIIEGRGVIVIDEIDISLDAAAQVRLVNKIRNLGKAYKVGFIFTTHSLAMMRTLESEELFYMDHDKATGVAKITNVSYNYIKSILYGFTGWDRYILTEDDVLRDFLNHVIKTYCGTIFFTYKIIYIGGGTNTTDLMKRNANEEFFSAPENVICVLDGDQRKYRHSNDRRVHCIPLESVEKALLEYCLEGSLKGQFDLINIIKSPPDQLIQYLAKSDSPNASTETQFNSAAKDLFKYLIKERKMSRQQIIEHLCSENRAAIEQLAATLSEFLKPTPMPTTSGGLQVS